MLVGESGNPKLTNRNHFFLREKNTSPAIPKPTSAIEPGSGTLNVPLANATPHVATKPAATAPTNLPIDFIKTPVEESETLKSIYRTCTCSHLSVNDHFLQFTCQLTRLLTNQALALQLLGRPRRHVKISDAFCGDVSITRPTRTSPSLLLPDGRGGRLAEQAPLQGSDLNKSGSCVKRHTGVAVGLMQMSTAVDRNPCWPSAAARSPPSRPTCPAVGAPPCCPAPAWFHPGARPYNCWMGASFHPQACVHAATHRQTTRDRIKTSPV